MADSGVASLPPHHPQCLGCGPDNPAGLHLSVYRDGDEVFTDLAFDARHRGAPGLAHGGAISAACDDLFGFVLYVVEEIAVTRTLTVEYRAPVPLGQRHRITARLHHRDGRRLHLEATGVGEDGVTRFTAQALFIVVDIDHFSDHGTELDVHAMFTQHPLRTREGG
ncbi:PaaI family thioesterase [Amycolatopsis roodepoortensis]|uniref:PaaI family thioesterase n=1 Tax=Amycolatopsis roodepoortensis TaxID=700274 RepID=UPI00214D075E|nr:PaaI family thioesterase [Amycolatopsis roodepoortensis]UUV28619.1 PaaI family thioesterase [Amycolatopsis roodepoortensis]